MSNRRKMTGRVREAVARTYEPRADLGTFWNGEPTPAICGTGVVLPSAAPLFWGRHLIGERIPVVQVNYYGDLFWLDNRDGYGWAKVTHGHGSPRYGHRNLLVADFVAAEVSQ